MILKQHGKLASHRHPWQLIRDAIFDLRAQEKLLTVCIRMGHWHLPVNGICYQCLSGACMSRRLGADTNDEVAPWDYATAIQNKLYALNFFGVGRIGKAFSLLRLDEDKIRFAGITEWATPRYADNPAAYKTAVLRLADDLEQLYGGKPVSSGKK